LASYRVDKTDKETVSLGIVHRHIAALCLQDGRRVPKATAIRNIVYRIEAYYTYASGQRAEVEVVDRCSQCHSAFLRTDRDTTTENNLLELPDCR